MRVFATLVASLMFAGIGTISVKVQMISKNLTILTVTAQVCSEEGAVRLVDGPTEKEGRVEICVNRRWGSACGSRSWSDINARITCRQLGYDCKN